LSTAHQSGCEGIFDEDEKIVWQGRTGTGLTHEPVRYAIVAFVVIFTGSSIMWMSGSFGWMFGLIPFLISAAVILATVFGGAYSRKLTWHTLTNRWAFIATSMLTARRRINDNEPTSVCFAHILRQKPDGSQYENIGFHRILDEEKVYALIRRVARSNA
jgi:hypothetical protein